MADSNPFCGTVWRCGGGDRSRRSQFARAARLSPKPVQHLKASGAVQASVVFTRSGTAFVADMAGVIHAFSSKGRLRWRVRLDAGISATPAVSADDELIVVATHSGSVYALETATGTLCWRRQIPSKSDPRILSDLLCLPQAGLVIFSTWGGRFHAVEVGSGREQFSWEAGIWPKAAAAADRDENLYCLRARPGQGLEFVRVSNRGEEQVLLHQPENPEGARRTLVAAGPVLDEERGTACLILNKARAGELVVCRMEDGTVRWRQSLPAAVQAPPAILPDGLLVIADLTGWVRSFSSEGTEVSSFATRSDYLLAGGAGQGDGVFYVGDPFGQVHQIHPRGEASLFFVAPRSIQGGLSFDPHRRLHVPCTDGRVYVFGPRERPPIGPT